MLEGAAVAMSVSADALAEVKAYLRVDGAGEDAAIAGLVSAAAAVCEAFGGVTLLAREFDETLNGGPAWMRLARTPVRSIMAVSDAEGSLLPIEAFATDIDADGDGWVRRLAVADLVGAASARMRVRYRAGLSETWGGLPAPLRQGVVRLASHLYVNRDGAGDVVPPAAVTALWRPYRRMPFGRAQDRPFGRARDWPFGFAHDERLR